MRLAFRRVILNTQVSDSGPIASPKVRQTDNKLFNEVRVKEEIKKKIPTLIPDIDKG
jgi:hypothetical protein